jgi:hypothetical protein
MDENGRQLPKGYRCIGNDKNEFVGSFNAYGVYSKFCICDCIYYHWRLRKMKTITVNNICFKVGKKYVTRIKDGKEMRYKVSTGDFKNVQNIMQNNDLLDAEKWQKVAKIVSFYL